MDRFAQVSAFVRTVERGSQAAAARDLGITPAMVGRHVRALEDRLAVRLLNRTTATQSLTEAGAAFHARAAALLDQWEDAERAAAERQPEPHGVLRVNAPMSFGARHLATAVAGFCARHAALQVDMVLNDRVVDLVQEGFDVAVRIGRLRDSALVARRLAPCHLVVCASPAYLARRGLPDRPAALRDHDCLLYSYASEGSTWSFRNGARQDSVRLRGSLVANNGDALLHAALAGQGIVLQPSFIAADALRDGRLVRVLPGWTLDRLDVFAVFPSSRHLPPKVRLFVDFLVAHFQDPPYWDAGLGQGTGG